MDYFIRFIMDDSSMHIRLSASCIHVFELVFFIIELYSFHKHRRISMDAMTASIKTVCIYGYIDSN